MMPIFFHVESHIWIFVLLVLNGSFIHAAVYSASQQYRELTRQFEAQVIMSFAFSLALNGLVLLSLDILHVPFSKAIYPLFIIWVSALFFAFKNRLSSFYACDISLPALIFYVLMFVILFYNGGMIDQISDAWWHMSLANKIGLANSFTLEYGHLTGAPERYYPPLWHGNLALLRELSG
ncbi:MAG: hypothetical protein MK188_16135, partial [Gammaproteobacteria bacterium]|nr:hypothetical protein [Gammaproteobacteria bacterium]